MYKYAYEQTVIFLGNYEYESTKIIILVPMQKKSTKNSLLRENFTKSFGNCPNHFYLDRMSQLNYSCGILRGIFSLVSNG